MFDFEKGPLIRVRLLRLKETEHAIIAATHHIICDAWSMEILAHEVTQIYDAFQAGQPSPLVPLQVQFADYSVWQRDYLQGEVIESLLKYWRQKLDGLTPFSLPSDRPRRPGVPPAQRTHSFQISRPLQARLNDLCHREQATLYMLMLAAFKVLLHRYSGADDIAV